VSEEPASSAGQGGADLAEDELLLGAYLAISGLVRLS
jgi:hypothetical protein